MHISDACVGCGQCAAFCPKDAIIVLGFARINSKCSECNLCIDYCPLDAISGEP